MRVGQNTMARLLADIRFSSQYCETWFRWTTRKWRVFKLGSGMAVKTSCILTFWESSGRAA